MPSYEELEYRAWMPPRYLLQSPSLYTEEKKGVQGKNIEVILSFVSLNVVLIHSALIIFKFLIMKPIWSSVAKLWADFLSLAVTHLE